MEAQHQAANERLKVNGGHATGACWAQRAVHQDRWLHRPLLPQPCAHMDANKAASTPESYWFCVVVLNVCRSLKIGLSGLHQAVKSERHVLSALSALQQWPYLLLSDKIVKIQYGFICIKNSEVYMPSSCLRGREHGQQVPSVCLVRIYWRTAGARRRLCVS
jgi:hypothetical protein